MSWSDASMKRKTDTNLKTLKIKKGDKVSIIAPNSPRWCIADLSIMSLEELQYLDTQQVMKMIIIPT